MATTCEHEQYEKGCEPCAFRASGGWRPWNEILAEAEQERDREHEMRIMLQGRLHEVAERLRIAHAEVQSLRAQIARTDDPIGHETCQECGGHGRVGSGVMITETTEGDKECPICCGDGEATR